MERHCISPWGGWRHGGITEPQNYFCSYNDICKKRTTAQKQDLCGSPFLIFFIFCELPIRFLFPSHTCCDPFHLQFRRSVCIQKPVRLLFHIGELCITEACQAVYPVHRTGQSSQPRFKCFRPCRLLMISPGFLLSIFPTAVQRADSPRPSQPPPESFL